MPVLISVTSYLIDEHSVICLVNLPTSWILSLRLWWCWSSFSVYPGKAGSACIWCPVD